MLRKEGCRREAAFKSKENEISSLLQQTSIPQRILIAVTTHKCSISSRSEVHSLGYTPSIPFHKPPPILLSCTILLACLTLKPLCFQAIIHCINQPFLQLTIKQLSTYILLAILSFPILSIQLDHQRTL